MTQISHKFFNIYNICMLMIAFTDMAYFHGTPLRHTSSLLFRCQVCRHLCMLMHHSWCLIVSLIAGQIRRLQPNKPSTIAQVAVALTSGRMIEAIQSELLRMQDEESSRKAAKEEIRQELLDRGEIERCWAEKMEEEKKRGLEVQQLYIDAVNLLEQEKIFQEGALNGFLKEKAAMDCQKQLLEILKEEINEISERLASERTEQISDEEVTQTLRSDLQIKKEGILDAKSVLEAEIEALRILR